MQYKHTGAVPDSVNNEPGPATAEHLASPQTHLSVPQTGTVKTARKR